MARIRTIKPDFWTDEKLSECSLSARLLFIGLISFADDEGRMEYAPARVRMQIFPCGSVPTKKLLEMVGELTERSLIRVYSVESKQYLDVPGFVKHQKINRPTPSKFPAHHGVLSEPSVSTPSGMEGNGKEGKGEGGARARATPEGLSLEAWNLYTQYRTKAKLPSLKPVSIPQAQKQLTEFGSAETQIAVVNQTIANGWTGLFALKHANGSGKPQPKFVPPPDDPAPRAVNA